MEMDMGHNDETFFVQKNKYERRFKKFLVVSGGAMVATMGAIVAAPALGALAIPVIAGTTLSSATAFVGAMANKVAENITDPYEDKSMRQKFSSGLKAMREKAFGVNSDNKLKM